MNTGTTTTLVIFYPILKSWIEECCSSWEGWVEHSPWQGRAPEMQSQKGITEQSVPVWGTEDLQPFCSLIITFPFLSQNINLSKFYWSASECVLGMNILVLASEALACSVCISALECPVSFEEHDSIQCSKEKKTPTTLLYRLVHGWEFK